MIPLTLAAAILGAAIAAVSGFGIGSVLTPALAQTHPAKLAVAAVAVPHFVATAYRFWLVREHLDPKLLKSFGAMSAAGGLLGAVVSQFFASRWLEWVLAALLIFVGIGGLAGWTKRLKFEGVWAWLAGGISGFLGGLVGNQGGLRAGAMTGLGVSRDAFVATATATGLIVDLARLPVYLYSQWNDLAPLWPLIGGLCLAAIVGTLIGMSALKRIPERLYLPTVSGLLIALGIWLAVKPYLSV